jgi:hypothetical protein
LPVKEPGGIVSIYEVVATSTAIYRDEPYALGN